MNDYDLLIAGGGINGAAIAREAAVAGWRVLLVERDDLGQHTSSASSKLIHGGLRYLEMRDFALVRHALKERERLFAAAPHLVRPMRFVLPHDAAMRPWWLIRAGLFLYDRLGGARSVPASRGLGAQATELAPLRGSGGGFTYWDGVVDDSRLVLANAIDAAENGARIATRTALDAARVEDGGWRATLSDGSAVRARAIVNAAGPWVARLLGALDTHATDRVRLVRGSHIAVPRLYEGDHAYILQQPDRRIVFVWPWQGLSAIGTTDVDVDTPDGPAISADEIAYLCEAASRWFDRPVTPDRVVATWSGIRPLHDDGGGEARAASRDHALRLSRTAAPLLSVFGGKITTARHLAEEAIGMLAPVLSLSRGPGTARRMLPGGDIGDLADFEARVAMRYPWLDDAGRRRMIAAYGSRLFDLLGDADAPGEAFGPLTAREARWMRDREWARTPDDALSRRSRLGLSMAPDDRARFERWWHDSFR